MFGKEEYLRRIERLTAIGIALSVEQNTTRLLETILVGAKELTGADGGTLYSVREDGTVKMEIMRTDSLGIALGGTTGKEIPFAPISLFDDDGNPNEHMVVTYAVLHDTTVNIPDAYCASGFDFSGTKLFDAKTGYRSQSFLTVPMRNHEHDIIAVLQLLNATDPETGAVAPFSDEALKLAESLASEAAIALTNRRLINDLKALLESLIQLVATAIDEKSPYTGGHCRRVPELTMMLAEAAHRQDSGPLAGFQMTDFGRYELHIAGWLHDCGKITTPEYVVDKASKLETIYDRIGLVDTRLEVLKRDARIRLLERRMAALERGEKPDDEALDEAYLRELEQLEADRRFLHQCNTGSEFMNEGDQCRVHLVGERGWEFQGRPRGLLDDEEVYNLTISKGTLTPEERRIINHHIVATIKMLEALPFPKHLKNVPEYAGGHHERMDGKGYPNGLRGEQMSVQARVMAIADIFEALTAKDRPYKQGKPLSEALRILGLMKQDGHIDPDLFDIFVRERVYADYAQRFLDAAQVDAVDETQIPGFAAKPK